MAAKPPSLAQRRANSLSLEDSAKMPNSSWGNSDRQFSNRPSLNRLTDCDLWSQPQRISAAHSGHRQTWLVLTLSRRQAAGKGASSWCRLSVSAGTRLCPGQSRHCRASEATFNYGDPGNLVTVSESGIQRIREDNLGEKQHRTRDNRREEGLKSQCKLHASRYQFALQGI